MLGRRVLLGLWLRVLQLLVCYARDLLGGHASVQLEPVSVHMRCWHLQPSRHHQRHIGLSKMPSRKVQQRRGLVDVGFVHGVCRRRV